MDFRADGPAFGILTGVTADVFPLTLSPFHKCAHIDNYDLMTSWLRAGLGSGDGSGLGRGGSALAGGGTLAGKSGMESVLFSVEASLWSVGALFFRADGVEDYWRLPV